VTQGGAEAVRALLAASEGGTQLNTAFIERLNATFRERLACLIRRCRHAARKVSRLQAGMWLVGCTYNFCWPHHELSRRATRAQDRRGEILLTPAMASGLTDHVWSVRELLTFRIPPPAWVALKRRGRPRLLISASKKPISARPRPLLRLRKGVLPRILLARIIGRKNFVCYYPFYRQLNCQDSVRIHQFNSQIYTLTI